MRMNETRAGTVAEAWAPKKEHPMFGGIGKVFQKAVGIATNPTGALAGIAGDAFGGIMKKALGSLDGGLFSGLKSLGDLMEKLRKTGLGSMLEFTGLLNGKETKLGLDNGKLGLPGPLAALQPAVDGIAQLIAGQGENASLLADMIGGALSGSKDPAEALENLKRLSEQLGLDKSVVSMLLEAMQEAGLIPAPAGPAQGAQAPAGAAGPAAAGGGGGGGGGGAGPVGGASSPKTPLGGNIDGAGGFLYKPFSDSDGKLVVLTPESMAGNVASVTVRGPDGSVLATGIPKGNGNGGRDHFRFDKPGSAFPPNVTVEVQLRDGSTKSYPIENPSLRYD